MRLFDKSRFTLASHWPVNGSREKILSTRREIFDDFSYTKDFQSLLTISKNRE